MEDALKVQKKILDDLGRILVTAGLAMILFNPIASILAIGLGLCCYLIIIEPA